MGFPPSITYGQLLSVDPSCKKGVDSFMKIQIILSETTKFIVKFAETVHVIIRSKQPFRRIINSKR